MTPVSRNDRTKAEVWGINEDAGCVEGNQAVKIKLAAIPFNNSSRVNGHVETISRDAVELPDTRERDRKDNDEYGTKLCSHLVGYIVELVVWNEESMDFLGVED